MSDEHNQQHNSPILSILCCSGKEMAGERQKLISATTALLYSYRVTSAVCRRSRTVEPTWNMPQWV